MKDLLNPEFTKSKMTNSFKHQPNKELWKLSIYELGKKQYHVFDNKITANYSVPIIPEDETLIVCVNFSSKELKMLLIDRLNINPIMYSECMLLSQVDKVLEFNDKAVFYNIVITKEYIDDDPIIIRVIRKKNVAVVVVKELENDNFKLSEEIAKKFGFKQIKTFLDPADKSMKDNSKADKIESALSSQSMDMPEEIVEKGEIGNVIIQKIKTILPTKGDKVTIDSILFWMSNEGLKRIENIINEGLLQEVNVIQLQSRDLGVDSKFEFLQKMDIFQNHYIGAQNAKESKR